jgi:hypothetical protein
VVAGSERSVHELAVEREGLEAAPIGVEDDQRELPTREAAGDEEPGCIGRPLELCRVDRGSARGPERLFSSVARTVTAPLRLA